MPIMLPNTEDLLFEQSYMVNTMPKNVLSGLLDSENNVPAALASAAYGYTRGNQFSPFNAAIFGFFGLSYPLISTLLFAFDAVFIQETPAKKLASQAYSKHAPSLRERIFGKPALSGFAGLSRGSRCVRYKRVNGRKRCAKYARR